jgi:Putative adhesin/Domain of unknown function (DUF5668)
MSNMGTPNPGTPPPMPPSPRPPRRRSFAGPFVLIVLGIVFLLGNMHMLSWGRIGVWFAHYWPVLLILWGVLKLIDYQRAQREGLNPPRIGAGGIFLVVVIVVCGLIATHVERFHWAELRDQINIDDEDLNNLFGETFNFDDHLEQDFPAGSAVKIIDTHGAVSVHASEDNKISVIVRKRIGADNQNDANKYNDETKPTITTIGGLVTLDAKTEGAGNHPVVTDIDVSVPRKAAVTISAHKGDVTLSTREGDVDISNQHGQVSVEEVKGNVKLSLERSSAKVEQITGDVHVEGRLNEVSVMDVNGGAQLDGEFMESVKLGRITKTVNFKSSRTDMGFSRIDGDLDLDSDDLRAEQVGGPVHLTTRSKNVRFDNVSGDVRMQDSNGGVDVTMRSPGNVQIDNRKGDIQLSVPDKPGFRVDARTRDGEIQSDFSELKVDNAEHEARATGQVGNGSSHIVLNNEHGGIEIRRASLQPPRPPEPPGAPKSGKALPAPKERVVPTEN